MITRSDVDIAAARIAGHIRHTPLIAADRPGTWLKCEFLQHTGSFKTRGAVNLLLAAKERGELNPAAGIVLASGGNAALGHAYAARRVGCPVTVVLPETASPMKVEMLISAGATIERRSTPAEAFAAAVQRAADTGAMFCHPYEFPEVVAGAGTVAAELIEDLNGEVDTILVAVGGGGLLGGIAAAAEGVARVIGVEPYNCASLHAALAAGGPVEVPVSGVAADSLGAPRIGQIAYAVATRTGVRSLLVDDEAIVAARRALWRDHRVAVEHGAAAAFSALASGAYIPADGERVAVIICGANTNPADLL
jgi:threonine dehydratase